MSTAMLERPQELTEPTDIFEVTLTWTSVGFSGRAQEEFYGSGATPSEAWNMAHLKYLDSLILD